MENLFSKMQEANSSIVMTEIKGKKYAEVHQRIKAFRMCFPDGAIVTELKTDDGSKCTFTATVYEKYPDKILGTGTAYEMADSSYINKTSYIENCETSAVGRALGMCGFGIDAAVASAEEVNRSEESISVSMYINELRKYAPKCEMCGIGITPVIKRDKTPWSIEEIIDYSKQRFDICLCPDCQKQKMKEEKQVIKNAADLPKLSDRK